MRMLVAVLFSIVLLGCESAPKDYDLGNPSRRPTAEIHMCPRICASEDPVELESANRLCDCEEWTQ